MNVEENVDNDLIIDDIDEATAVEAVAFELTTTALTHPDGFNAVQWFQAARRASTGLPRFLTTGELKARLEQIRERYMAGGQPVVPRHHYVSIFGEIQQDPPQIIDLEAGGGGEMPHDNDGVGGEGLNANVELLGEMHQNPPEIIDLEAGNAGGGGEMAQGNDGVPPLGEMQQNPLEIIDLEAGIWWGSFVSGFESDNHDGLNAGHIDPPSPHGDNADGDGTGGGQANDNGAGFYHDCYNEVYKVWSVGGRSVLIWKDVEELANNYGKEHRKIIKDRI
ncbi:unnamed protein product [Lactuca virosa]|uniref:Uncharacterized protein n=1 Tax=Lactuca virosa TaxID=75947 RepID=A0AAU9P0H3_9ASTR|nr:unnamed protein product [Lactuca virosa]